MHFLFDAPLFQRTFRNFSAVSGVGSRSLRNLFAEDEIAAEFGKYLGYGLANLAAVVNPAVFVIGGGVSKAGEVLIPYIEKPYKERAFFADKNVRFVLAQLGNDAGICGSAKLVLDEKKN